MQKISFFISEKITKIPQVPSSCDEAVLCAQPVWASNIQYLKQFLRGLRPMKKTFSCRQRQLMILSLYLFLSLEVPGQHMLCRVTHTHKHTHTHLSMGPASKNGATAHRVGFCAIYS